MTTCGITLFLACTGFFFYEWIKSENDLRVEVETLSEIIANNSIAALEFEDEKLGQETLNALATDPKILSSALYLKDGRLFSAHARNETGQAPSSPGQDGLYFKDGNLIVFHPIEFDGSRLGTLYMQVALDVLSENLKLFFYLVIVVLLISFPVIFYLSRALQNLVTRPIENLKKATQHSLTHGLDETVIEVESNDEIGEFAASYKDMIGKLNRAEKELKTYSGQLEDLVKTRTEELILEKDRAEKANQAKSDFLSRMSHELRTPMNAILGFTQLLEMDTKHPLADYQMNDLARISAAGEHLLQLINEVLDLSKIESGNLDLEQETVDMNGIVEDVLALSQPLADKGHIVLDYLKPAERHIYVEGDALRLRQVALNLISNAIKYNKPAGRVTVAFETPQAGNQVRLGIRDEGMGIPEEKRSELFKPFCRFDEDANQIEGTGIGLTISRQLIELMHGAIGYESLVGKGSYFYIDIPVAHDSPRPGGAVGESIPAVATMQSHKKALYIEDITANMELVKKILKTRADVELIWADNAVTGIELAKLHRPDLILMDIHLPGRDGLTAFKKLREDAATKDIPVIAVTADAMSGDLKRAMDMGFKAYVTKPIHIPTFLKIINEVLD